MNKEITDFSKAYFILKNDIYSGNINSYSMQVDFQEFNVYFTEDLKYKNEKINNYNVLIIGDIIHTKNGMLSPSEILHRLLNHTLDSYDFLTELSYLNGSFILLIESEGTLYLYNDATSLKSLYYHDTKPVYASHSKLVHELLKEFYNINVSQKMDKANGFLDLSRYQDIYKFNANTRLNVTKNEIKRIYPFKKRKEKSADEVFELIDQEIKETLKYIMSQNKKIICSLTAGHDSKVSLSYLKKYIDKITFFTYTRNLKRSDRESFKKIYRTDQEIVQAIADNLNLNHTLFNMNDFEIDDQLLKDYELFETSHSVDLVNYYAKNKNFHDTIHIKSTIFELAKNIIPEKEGPNTYQKYIGSLNKWTTDKDNDLDFIEESLTGFIKRNDAEKALSYSYDAFDILYYESRMNGWHASIVQETDSMLVVLNIINTRNILFEMMSLKKEDRINSELHNIMIKRNWPILNYFQVNEVETLEDYTKSLEDKLEKEKLKNNSLTFESSDFISRNKSFEFQMKNIDFQIGIHKEVLLSNVSTSTIKVQVKTFYSNEKGKNMIFFEIDKQKIDLVDLSQKELYVEIEPNEIKAIKVYSSKDLNKKSWTDAAKFEVIIKNN